MTALESNRWNGMVLDAQIGLLLDCEEVSWEFVE